MSEAPRGGPGASGPDTGAAVALALARRGDRAPDGGQAPRRFLRVNQDRSRVPNFIPRVRRDTEQERVNHATQADSARRPAVDGPTPGQAIDQVVLFQALMGMFQGDSPQRRQLVDQPAAQPEDQTSSAQRVPALRDGATTTRSQPTGERVFAGGPFRTVRDKADEEQILRDATEGFLVDKKGRRITDSAHEASRTSDGERRHDGETKHAPEPGAAATSLQEDAPGRRNGKTGKPDNEAPLLSHPGDLRTGHADKVLTFDSSYRAEKPHYSFNNFTSDLINLRILSLLTLKPPDKTQKALPPGFIPGVGCTDAVTPEDYMPITIFNLLFRFKQVAHSYKKYGNVDMPIAPGNP